ncbi:DUF4175 family protein [Azospirillum brasilense]|uniref:DUF4175 family protein n=1 Tax=Azospirillum brasilense TaxID=192 RepID=UPI0006889A8A|nr:DUF4175 family protein [Azospirillum brasilense]
MSDSNDGFRFPPRKEAPPAPVPREPRLRMGQARAALLWERLALWAPITIAGAFLALALLNVFLLLPGWLHALVLLLFVAAIGWTGWRGLRAFRLPDEDAARRRLERDSGLPHRPLHALRDRPSGNDPVAAELWRLHQERVRAAMRRRHAAVRRPRRPGPLRPARSGRARAGRRGRSDLGRLEAASGRRHHPAFRRNGDGVRRSTCG